MIPHNLEDKAKKILSELLLYTHKDGVKYTIRTSILITELIALSNHTFEYELTIKTLIGLKNANLKSIKSLNSQYKKYLDESRKTSKKWTIILPYSNLLLKKKFRILNDGYKIINQKTFKNIINQEEFSQAVSKAYKYREQKFELADLFIQLEVSGKNLSSCWSSIRTNFTILQGIYDFGLYKGVWIVNEGPLTCFVHPEWILGRDESGKLEFNTFLIYGKARAYTHPSRFQPAIEILDKARIIPKPNSTKSLIYDAFRLYAQAMEAVHRHNSFLSFWQLLEHVCVTEYHGGHTTEVIKRLDVIIKENKPFDFSIEGLYKSLASKRNDIVHKGIDNIGDREVNILKLLSETAIEWLMNKEKDLKTKAHINEFFNLRTKNEKDKQAIFETIKFINKGK
jgi:hypothetical protein